MDHRFIFSILTIEINDRPTLALRARPSSVPAPSVGNTSKPRPTARFFHNLSFAIPRFTEASHLPIDHRFRRQKRTLLGRSAMSVTDPPTGPAESRYHSIARSTLC
jgi:hypothetical protein